MSEELDAAGLKAARKSVDTYERAALYNQIKTAILKTAIRAYLAALPPASGGVTELLREARAHVASSNSAEHMMDGIKIVDGEPVARRKPARSDDLLARIDAALSAPKPVVEGWVMVPREADHGMGIAGFRLHGSIKDRPFFDQCVAIYRAMVASAPQPPETGTGSYHPQIIHYEGEGDPYSEFVERDTATITGGVYAAHVEAIFDFDRRLIGFRIYGPRPGLASAPQPPETGPEDWE